MLKKIKTPILITLIFILICGVIYPLVVTGIGQIAFKGKANGSLVTINGTAVGSKLVGQDFTDERFMKCRPSAVNYNMYAKEDKESGKYKGIASGSSNYGPSNSALMKRVEEDMAIFLKNNPDVKREDIPTDLLTASGSGLDPHISPASAKIQIPKLVRTTRLSKEVLTTIVEDNTKGKVLGLFGEETVNVLMVNLEIAKKINEL